MKLLIVSDPQLEPGVFNVPKIDYEAVVLSGAISLSISEAMRWARRAGTFAGAIPVIFVPGIHEFYSGVLQTMLKDMRLAVRLQNIHVLDCDEIIIGGVRFLGCALWTDFTLAIDAERGALVDPIQAMMAADAQLDDYRRIRWLEAPRRIDPLGAHGTAVKRKLTPEDTLEFHRRDRRWLAQRLAERFNGPTVVVTRHAPHRRSLALHQRSSWLAAAYASELSESFFEVPILWIHGHAHEGVDYRVGNCRVVCHSPADTRDGHERESRRSAPGFEVEV